MSVSSSFDFFIEWHLTEKSNLLHAHSNKAARKSHDMSFPSIKKSIHEIADTLTSWRNTSGIDFSPIVHISGGEPFLRTNLFKILREFQSRNFDIHIHSNGMLVDKISAKKLFAHQIKGVQVTIEGPQKVHESIRGKESFSASLKGIDNLLEAGLEVTMNVAFSSFNAAYYMDLLQLSSSIGVQKLAVSRCVPSGRGEAMLKGMLKTEEVRHLYEKIFSMTIDRTVIVSEDPLASETQRKQQAYDCGDIALGGCSAGISGLTILPDGTLVPCRHIPVPLGNINRDSLEKVWTGSEVLNALRNRAMYKGKCGTCEKWAHCRGCRAIAFAYSNATDYGDLLAQDPQCFIH